MTRLFLFVAAAAGCADTSAILDPDRAALVTITPALPTAQAFGNGPTLTASATGPTGLPLPDKQFTWSSSSPAVASVAPGGAATAASVVPVVSANGSTIITATADGVSGTVTLIVSQAVSAVSVSPTGPLIGYTGQVFQAAASLRDANGFPVTGRTVSWTSSAPGVATVSSGGAISIAAPGTTTLTARADNATGVIALRTRTGPIYLEKVSAGDAHTCGIGTDGHSFCWGANAAGQLGSGGSAAPVPSPIEVVDVAAYEMVSVGAGHACATTSLFARCWGSNVSGAIGTGSRGGSAGTPSLVGAPVDFIAIAAGDEHTCALSQGHAAWCWGNNPFGQIGVASATASGVNSATAVSGGILFTAIDAGGGHTCAVAGPTYCWGRNVAGEVGDGTTTNRNQPAVVTGGHAFADVSTGGHHSCAIKATGEVFCWGLNDLGQLGDGTTTNRSAPVRAANGILFFSVSAGANHTCGVSRSGGVVHCWGDNASGQLGNNSTTSSLSPVAVSSSVAFDAVSAGGRHTCGLSAIGSVYCWGRNVEGQLGDVTTANRTIPTLVFGSRSN